MVKGRPAGYPAMPGRPSNPEAGSTRSERSPEQVDFRVAYRPLPVDKAFPLTPMEAWYGMQGYAVRPPVTCRWTNSWNCRDNWN